MNASLLAAGGADLVAASGSATVAGDNSNARLLADIRNQNLASGSTASEAWAQLVYRVGRDRQAAASAERTQSEVTQQMRNLQDGVSGVSLDEEAADLMRFQRAYEANARFFTTVDETLATLAEHGGCLMRVTFNMSYRNGVLDIQRASEALQARRARCRRGAACSCPATTRRPRRRLSASARRCGPSTRTRERPTPSRRG